MEFIRPDQNEDTALWRRRILCMLAVVLGAFAVLGFRLWHLQILQGDTFGRLSDKNRIRLLRVPFTRGLVFDRKGRMVADNRPSFRLVGVPAEIVSHEQTLLRLVGGVMFDNQAVAARIAEAKHRAPFRPVTFKEDLPWDEVAWVETRRLHLPGIWVEVEPRRFYPYGSYLAHVLGYVGEISEDLMKRWGGRGYRAGDMVGKCGLEWRLESYLRGRDGGLQVEVDAQGRQLEVIQEVSYVPGANVTLTIDIDLQKAAEDALGSQAGAVIAGDPITGEILAMASHPPYDPNLFSAGISQKDWKALLEDPKHPLQNRVTTAQYPPGSVHKIITAVAGLEEKVITPETRLFCPGHYKVGNATFGCWKRGGHGWMRLREAIVQSCDVYFYQVGQRLGVDRLAKYAKAFGLGRPTGLDPEEEKSGLIPTKSWKKKRFGDIWHPGETLSVAIGQGYNLVTPLQQFVMISAMANGGKVLVPQLVRKVESPSGHAYLRFEPKSAGSLPVSDKTLRFVKEALKGVVHDERGTGKRARVEGLEVGGKTGTAQVIGLKDRKKNEEVPYKFRDHAWFVCFAPVNNPRLAVVAFVEHGGHGGAAAAPVAQRIMKAFFNPSESET